MNAAIISNLNISPRGARDCFAEDIFNLGKNASHGNNTSHEETDEEELNLVIDISRQINSDDIEFSTVKSSKRMVMTRDSSKKP